MGMYQFCGSGQRFVGAPEKLMRKLPGNWNRSWKRAAGLSLWAMSRCSGKTKRRCRKRYSRSTGVVLEDTIRENTRETLDFFHREGVDVKVISGDHVKTVSMIAKRAGLYRWKGCRGFIDARRGH